MDITELENIDSIDTSGQPKEATLGTYFEGINPLYTVITNPDLRYKGDIDKGNGVNIDDPAFKQLYDEATPEVKDMLLTANNLDEARLIYQRNAIRQEALKTIEQDTLFDNIVMGLPAAVLSPTSLIPASPVFKAFKVKEAVSLAEKIGKTGLAAGVYGGGLAATDEAIFASEGVINDPVGAFGYGLAFGGALGAGTGALASVFSKGKLETNGKLASSKSDTITADLEKDPDIVMTTDKSGVPKMEVISKPRKGKGRKPKAQTPMGAIMKQAYGTTSVQRMDKSLLDFGPLKWLNSDIAKLYQSPSPLIRTIASKLAKSTVALKDASGKYLAWGQDAWSYKRNLGGMLNRKNEEVRNAFHEATHSGEYIGNFESFVDSVSDEYIRAADKQEQEFFSFLSGKLSDFKGQLEELRMKIIDEELNKFELTGDKEADMAAEDAILKRVERRVAEEKSKLKAETAEEFYKTNTIDKYIEHLTPNIKRAVKAYKKFFNEHLQTAKKLNMKGLKNIHPERIYVPRIFDFDAVKLDSKWMAKLKEDVYRGLRANPLNADLSDEVINRLADTYVEGISSTRYKQSFTHDNYISPPAQSRAERLKYHFATEHMRDYFRKNLEDITAAYHHQMSGREALTNVFGDDIAKDIPTFLDEVRKNLLEKEGAIDMGDISRLQNVINDIGGTLRLNPHSGEPAWQFVRTLESFQTARLGGGFGVLQGIEAVTSAVFSGIGPILRSGRIGTAVKEAVRVMYKEGKVKDSFAQFVRDMGFYSDILEPHHINRFSESGMELGERPFKGFNFVHKHLQKFNDIQFKYNGLKVIKAFTEDILAAGITQHLKEIGRLSRDLTDKELRRISHYGLDDRAAKALGKKLDEVNGDIRLLPKKYRDLLQNAITNGIEETLVQGDSIYLPTWAKIPNAARELVMQFMRFPLIAHNIYLRKGYTEEQARMFASVLTSMVVYGAYRYLREQAAIVLSGNRDSYKTKYDIFDPVNGDENLQRALIIGLSYSPNLGMFTSAGIGTAKLLGITFPSNDYRSRDVLSQYMGPSYSMAEDVIDLVRKVKDDSYITDERALMKAKGLFTPSIPVLNEALNEYIRRNY